MSDTGVCDKCGEEYEHYHILVPDNFSDIVEYLSEDRDLCKECRVEEHPNSRNVFLTEDERKELRLLE